ncbi:ArsC family reductase [Nitrogeniibacter mangrovi]|uniref:ArsC family reductase n=1 Tax=Nitrogeniibacter mangrovi TaxID=2016596 RepID=A0A6C1B4J3_9RHOO|nr:ArsC family reductase [Nitrogeniibacter mangrovi]QID17785.1 ArsC family reductase [Nitrogeniibacter mangrovi]
MITIYGIRNCDTMKKAFQWLDTHGVAYAFHDYTKAGIDAQTLHAWLQRVERGVLVNTRGTTWRKLPAEQQAIDTDADAVALMTAHPSLIKRPVLVTDDAILVGFKPDDYATALGA